MNSGVKIECCLKIQLNKVDDMITNKQWPIYMRERERERERGPFFVLQSIILNTNYNSCLNVILLIPNILSHATELTTS